MKVLCLRKMLKNSTFICDENGVRIDVYLSNQLSFTRSRVKKLCDDGLVKVNDKLVKANNGIWSAAAEKYLLENF